jgi:hypothetical protein
LSVHTRHAATNNDAPLYCPRLISVLICTVFDQGSPGLRGQHCGRCSHRHPHPQTDGIASGEAYNGLGHLRDETMGCEDVFSPSTNRHRLATCTFLHLDMNRILDHCLAVSIECDFDTHGSRNRGCTKIDQTRAGRNCPRGCDSHDLCLGVFALTLCPQTFVQFRRCLTLPPGDI